MSTTEDRYHWRLEDIFSTEEAWEERFKEIEPVLTALVAYRGNVAESGETLLEVLRTQDKLGELLEPVVVYAKMRLDEDNRDTLRQQRFDRALALATRVESETAFILPEILEVPTDTIERYLREVPELRLYERYLNVLLRRKAHILSADEERILALAGEVAESPDRIFSMLNDADLTFPEVTDSQGRSLPLTKGSYTQLLESNDRTLRQHAFETLYATYNRLRNTLGATLGAEVRKNLFFSRARHYPSARQAALDANEIPESVYDNLVTSVRSHLDLLHRYVALRKRALGLDQLHMYDLYVPILQTEQEQIPYERAVQIVKEGLWPLGEEYLRRLDKGLHDRWVDVYEKPGKTSGAYSWGAYGTHPYVLMNYQGNLDSVFTIAHEMGHAMHTLLSGERQPYVYSHYVIFVAEVASTVNESLLIQEMLDQTQEKKRRQTLLNHYLESFRGTLFRQTMFAEFEAWVHAQAEAGNPPSPEEMSRFYLQLNRDYFGPEVEVDRPIGLEWARIPHFYMNFYVYQYATSFAAATTLAQRIRKDPRNQAPAYLEFLSSGSSKPPLQLLSEAGVDLRTPAPIEEALTFFGELLDEMEQLITDM
ncbi:MAG: oligoendopeptidase F [Firmicutes bacterium]|nr:oligoendopeptidase F [Bacillota bacterium]